MGARTSSTNTYKKTILIVSANRGCLKMNNKKHIQKTSFKESLSLALACSILGVGQSALATEGGGSSYPMGAENFMSGAMPPPGFYGMAYMQHYEADDLNGNDGKSLPIDFKLRANVIAPRFVWVTEQKVLGGDLAVAVTAPLVDLKVSVNGESDRKQELGDIIVGSGLGYHYSDKFHAVYAVDVIVPTGQYDKNDMVNIGRNYWAIQPVAAFSYVDPAGLNVDVKAMYDFNMENPDTDYKSGQEVHADFAVGWGLNNGWVVGVGGYAYTQTTDDEVDGSRVKDNKGKAFAIGPSIKYSSPDGWFVTAKWQQEQSVRNRPEGEAYWIKLAVPF